MNYAKNLAIDKNNNVYPGIPPVIANQQWSGVPVSSSVIGLTDRTTVIDVTALGGQGGNAAILGKWGPNAVSTSNFDWVVSSGQTRTLVVPVSVMGNSQSIMGANGQNGLYKSMAIIVATAQSASVFGAEY